MKSFISRQPKQVKERVEAKLDERLVRKLEQYCQYLDSDRDYIIGQLLEIAFKKDRGFAEWLASQDAALPPAHRSGPARKERRNDNGTLAPTGSPGASPTVAVRDLSEQ